MASPHRAAHFWDMRHAILVNNAALNDGSFATFARDLKLDMATFDACVANPAGIEAQIQADQTAGQATGVSGTPSFVIGRTAPAGLDGVRIVGAQPYQVIDAKLKELLTPMGATP